MTQYFISSVATCTLFDGETLIGVAKTLINNTFDLTLQQVGIRGGDGAPLLAMYSHSPTFKISIENALFDLNYIRLQTGGSFKIGSDFLDCEVVQCKTDGEIEVTNEPVKFYNTQIVCGWLEDNGLILFNGKIATDSRFKAGNYYLVRYYQNVPQAKEIMIPSSIIPKTITAVFDIKLYFTESDYKGMKRVGTMQVQIPRLQLDGNVNMAMSATGYTTSKLSGTALLYGDENCENGYLAKISEDIKLEVPIVLSEIDDLTLDDIDIKEIQQIEYKMVAESTIVKEIDRATGQPKMNYIYE
ncbi:MAG: hypothetical protein ACRCTZ_21055 [Sarcina sp.]